MDKNDVQQINKIKDQNGKANESRDDQFDPQNELEPFYLMNTERVYGNLPLKLARISEVLNRQIYNNENTEMQLSQYLPPQKYYDLSKKLENSTIESVIQKPPTCQKVLRHLTSAELTGFRLYENSIATTVIKEPGMEMAPEYISSPSTNEVPVKRGRGRGRGRGRAGRKPSYLIRF